MNSAQKSYQLARRQQRVRQRVFGTDERPRLNVYRSLNNIYAQLIDDGAGRTLVSVSTLSGDAKAQVKRGGNIEAAKAVGRLIAERAKSKGVENVVFDRSGYIYHGRIRALAEAAREAGLKF